VKGRKTASLIAESGYKKSVVFFVEGRKGHGGESESKHLNNYYVVDTSRGRKKRKKDAFSQEINGVVFRRMSGVLLL